MGPIDKHQLKIATDTMKLHCTGALILGGLPEGHLDAVRIIKQITGKDVTLPDECKCDKKGWH